MANISTKINLSALSGASIIKSGKNKDVDCILIPIEMNHFYKSDKGAVYLELIGFETAPDKRKENSKDTHLVKQSIPKDILDKMTKEEQQAFPILGNHVDWRQHGEGGATAETGAKEVASESDLPF